MNVNLLSSAFNTLQFKVVTVEKSLFVSPLYVDSDVNVPETGVYATYSPGTNESQIAYSVTL